MKTLSFKLMCLTVVVFTLSLLWQQQALSNGAFENQQDIVLDIQKGTLLYLPIIPKNIFIADPNIIELKIKSPNIIHISGKNIGQTTLYAINERGKPVMSYRITVQHNLTALRNTLNRIFPNENIIVDSANDAILLRGYVSSPTVAEDIKRISEQFLNANVKYPTKKLLNLLRISRSMQVNLRVTIIEMKREIRKALGVSWQGTISAGSAIFGISTGSVPMTDDIISASFKSNNTDLSAFVNLLDSQRLINILSEPNLTTISGETATFLAGGEFPVISSQGALNPALVSFREFGVSLAFTPTLLDDKTINLRVRPEVSQLSETGSVKLNGFNIPSLSMRRADTTVQLRSGQSLVIAGLLQNNAAMNIKKFPGLARVPILGKLFSSQRFQKDQTELVIIVTPYTVKPVTKGKLTMAPTALIGRPSALSSDLETMPKGYEEITYTID